MAQVDPVRTPLSPAELRGALAEGYRRHFAKEPSEDCLSVAWAQVALETGRGKGCWNFNLGNIKAGSTWKGADGLWTHLAVPPPEPPDQRAYPTADEGAEDYWRLLDTDRFRRALPWFEAGDAANAAVALGETGYYGAPIATYSATMVALQAEYLRTFSRGGTGRASGGSRLGVLAIVWIAISVAVAKGAWS